MVNPIKWQRCRGAVIQNSTDSGDSLAPYVSDEGGIYFWKLRYHAEAWELSDAVSMVSWLNRLTSAIRGRSQTRTLSHILQVPTVEIRGRPLTADKAKYLLEFLKDPKSRRWLRHYVESLEQFSPTLYVGETGNLRRRASEHVRHLTDFGVMVQDSDELSWEQLDFHFLPLRNFDSQPDKLRKSVEYISAALTIAGLTKRPG